MSSNQFTPSNVRRLLNIPSSSDLSKLGGVTAPHTSYDKDDFESFFKITSGQYDGAFRAYQNGKILWFFTNFGVLHLADKFAGTGFDDLVLPYIKKQLDNVVIARQDSVAYNLNNKITIEDMTWECTTAGTSAGSSTFPASNSVGDLHTDGTAVFTARRSWFGGSDHFLEDTADNLTGLVAPDSHDTYATSLFLLIKKYEDIVNNTYSWTAGASNHGAFSYKAIIDGLYLHNIKDELTSNLVRIFQGGKNPKDGSANTFQLTHDNCVNLGGLQALSSFYDELSDTTRKAQVDSDISDLTTGILALYDSGEGRFLWVAGEDKTATNSSIRLARHLAQVGALTYLADTDLTAAQRISMRTYMDTQIPDRWFDTIGLTIYYY